MVGFLNAVMNCEPLDYSQIELKFADRLKK